MMKLRPLPTPVTRVDACAQVLRGLILDGSFAVGARLPAERELAETLKVTRVTLRSALARLSAKGLVSSHQGRGTIVQDFRCSGGPDLIAELPHGVGITRDLLAVRRALARVVLERIAEVRPDPAPVVRQVQAFADDVADGADAEALAQADLRILGSLLDATGSPVFQLCLHPILRVLRGVGGLRQALYREPEENLLGWQVLAAWMADPNPDDISLLENALVERDVATLACMES